MSRFVQFAVAIVASTLFTNPVCSYACVGPTSHTQPCPPAIVIDVQIYVKVSVVFQTVIPHSCGCGLALLNPSPTLSFDKATVGVFNMATNAFAPVVTGDGSNFDLTRNEAADSAWATGVGADGSAADTTAGVTWFAFSNTAVAPVTPPLLGVNEMFAICFHFHGSISGPGCVQIGSGLAKPNGLPDFNDNGGHGARFSATIPEPSSLLSLGLGLIGFAAYRLKGRKNIAFYTDRN